MKELDRLLENLCALIVDNERGKCIVKRIEIRTELTVRRNCTHGDR